MLENKNYRTELEQLGEFGLINHLAAGVTLKNPSTVQGIGDAPDRLITMSIHGDNVEEGADNLCDEVAEQPPTA